jgi:hypothetical protein
MESQDMNDKGQMTWMTGYVASAAAGLARNRVPLLVLVVVLCCGTGLGGCSKCDVPTWQHSQSGQNPMSCHDTPSVQ